MVIHPSDRRPGMGASSRETVGTRTEGRTPMLALFWNLSAAIRGYLRFYMPTNRALDWLRPPRGLKWAVPAAIVLTPGYLCAMSFAAVIGAWPGLGWVNVLVLLFCWNAMKFAWIGVFAVLAIPVSLGRRVRNGRHRNCTVAPTQAAGADPVRA